MFEAAPSEPSCIQAVVNLSPYYFGSLQKGLKRIRILPLFIYLFENCTLQSHYAASSDRCVMTLKSAVLSYFAAEA